MAESERPAVLYGIQPYMFEPESDPDDEETPAEETQMRMEQDVSEWLFDTFMYLYFNRVPFAIMDVQHALW